MPVRRINIPRIDCGDKSGCLSEFVSVIVFMLAYCIFGGIIIFTLAGICCGIANLFG